MKRCPQCRRDYYDETLLFCLDDGNPLLDGPASGSKLEATATGFVSDDEPQTAILSEPRASADSHSSEAVTQVQPHTTQETAALPSHTASKKNSLIAGAIGILLVTALGIGSYWLYGRGGTDEIRSIAVMPFANEGGNPEIEYLADGMTESLIGSLSQIPDLSVKARSSVFRFKGKDADVRTLGKELNVQAILSGRVVPRGNDVALYLELIDAASENVIFKADYVQPMANLVALQKSVAHDVSQKLSARLSEAEQGRVEKSHTQNAEAYRLYLQGRFHWNKRQPEEHRKAINYFQQAIALDPNYALAYAGVADCYAVDSSPVKGPEQKRLLREAAVKALELDPTLGPANAALANAYWLEYDWRGAEREFKRAIELDPNYPSARQWYGELLSRLGRHDEAIDQLRLAAELDPLSLIIASDQIYILAFAGRYDEAIAQADRTIQMDALWRQAHFLKSLVYELKGDIATALVVREQALKAGVVEPERTKRLQDEIAQLREALRTGGAEAYWRRELAFELEDRQRPGEFSPFYIAEIYAALNEKDDAFQWLNRAIDENDDFVDGMKVSPTLDNLHNDPRWPVALARINLTP